ncbi:tannase/feruloyl esterase family alpha/beta hydrolase [Propionivibrio dicarboxylicus]|uniref:Feruloyl esterase n=1 Tax=Propionivibrio dicarboxylicus TaxID=83767 RepID=A0A1G8AKX8_9RHOO|nr:tannase/feruloyl esterase family alpha/beta hydrolase [Propionivibrio dicarboxylicus]SDH21672.1 feruloyl esterase [Propionivibrio dicarboxylicus]
MSYGSQARFALKLSVASCLAAMLGGCFDSGGSNNSPAAVVTETACTDLATQFKMDGVTIESVKEVAAATSVTGGIGASGPVVGTDASGYPVGVEKMGPMPAHCVIRGSADPHHGADGSTYAIGFEVRLPIASAWNGRFFFQGGGGVNGFMASAYGNLRGNLLDATGMPEDNALNRGFAVASTDSGHRANTASTDADAQTLFGADPQARLDYGYNAVARTTTIAKALINKRYGRSQNYSYFVGCSNGGRDAMVASQRLPNEFDGVFALNPGFQLPKAAVNQAWDTQQFYSLSTSIYDAFTKKDMDYVASRIMTTCDALDGAADGLVQDRAACDTAISAAITGGTLFATGAKDSGTGLTAAQITALTAVFGGVKDSSNASFYSDFPYDAGISYRDWRSWKLGIANPATSGAGSAVTPSQAVSIGAFSLPAVFMSAYSHITGDTSTSSANALAWMNTVKTALVPTGAVDPTKIYATSGLYTTPAMDATANSGVGFMSGNSINYDTFKARKSRLIVAHGTSDGVFSSNDTKNWYKALKGKYSDAATFARYFEIPGMNHCSGGRAADKFDMVTALVNWVEKGTVPDSVTATVRDQNYLYAAAAWTPYKPDTTDTLSVGINATTIGKTRPLCAYPTVAKSTDGGTSWTCQ